MKKIFSMMLLGTFLATAVQAQFFGEKKKTKSKSYSFSNAKKTRGALERCIEELRYEDTTQNSLGTLTLVHQQFYEYSGTRGSNGITKAYGIFPEISEGAPSFDKAKRTVDVNSPYDSTIFLQNYDAQDRLLVSKEIYYTGTTIDTYSTVTYIYSGSNKIPDSVLTLVPSFSPTLFSMQINKISANRIDTAITYYDFGTGLLPVVEDVNIYDAASNVISKTTASNFGFGSTTYDRELISYLANGLVDSITILSGTNIATLSTDNTVSIDYNANYSTGKYVTYDVIKDATEFGNFDIDAAKNVTKIVSFEIDGADTLNVDSSLYSYTVNNNLVTYNTWNGGNTGTSWQPYDSARLKYQPIIYASIGQVKSIENLSVLPTVVTNTAYVHYATNKMTKAKMIVTNNIGAVVYSKNLEALNGNTLVAVDASNLAIGTYNVMVTAEDGSSASTKFAKQ
jgi:hypothetical protein